MTNQDASSAAGVIGRDVMEAVAGRTPEEARALRILTGLQHGQIDRSEFTALCNDYFTTQTISDFENSLRPLGEPLSLSMEHEAHRGGMIFRSFRIQFKSRNLGLTTYEMLDGKLEQFLVMLRD